MTKLAIMYREENGHLTAKGGGIIIENKHLVEAATGGRGFLFSDTPAGAKALVLLGNKEEIFAYFDDWRKATQNWKIPRGIENQIKKFPRMFMNIYKYVPKQRYEGLFPVHAAVNSVMAGALNALGGGIDTAFGTYVGQMLKDLVGAGGDIKEWAGDMKDFYKNIKYIPSNEVKSVLKARKEAKKNQTLYIRIQYDDLQCVDQNCIGSGFVSFQVLDKIIEVALGGRPEPATPMKKEED